MKKLFHFDKNNISLAALFFSSLATVLSIYSIIYSRPELSKETIKIIKHELKILDKSNKDQILLAKHLTKIGAKLYGTDWCSFTQQQKILFGKEGSSLLDFQDCENLNNRECEFIESYPTWIINNKKVIGFLSLEELKEISNYKEK